MQMLGVDVGSYNIYNELGFLLKPTMRRFIQPTLAKYLGGMSDAEVEEVALEYAEAMREKANEKGYINLFGIQVGANAFDGLKDILTDKFNE
jgi:thioesterase domain-containing protein